MDGQPLAAPGCRGGRANRPVCSLWEGRHAWARQSGAARAVSLRRDAMRPELGDAVLGHGRSGCILAVGLNPWHPRLQRTNDLYAPDID